MAILQKNLKSMSTTCITNYMCIYMHHIHIHVPHAQMCTTCITNYRYIFMHHLHIHAPPNMHVCRCTIYTYMHHKHTCAPHASLNTHVHHQTPPKIKIPSWPSLCTLWPGQNDICVESAVFVAFEVLFMKSIWKAHTFHEKCNAFHDKHQFSWKAPLFKRPFARNCNPMFSLNFSN